MRGQHADRLLDTISASNGHGHAFSVDRLTVPIDDPDFGFVEQAVNRKAHFVARGDSFPLHQQVVADVIGRYRAFVEAVEARTTRFASPGDAGGGTMSGTPIEIEFSRPLPSLALLFDELFSSREPFRLWGLHRADDRYGECDAVDLHVGACMRVEAQPQFLRVQVYEGACGNSVAPTGRQPPTPRRRRPSDRGPRTRRPAQPRPTTRARLTAQQRLNNRLDPGHTPSNYRPRVPLLPIAIL